ncbi:MAG: ATP-binding cassette domain-containing protein, partial [Actinomycetota bacterium]|nr:ATP-binding cassette domain-containing protein [Actinomycetota bacterium]
MSAILEVKSVSVCFGSVDAVRDVSLEVMAGSIVGLIGPNGAGKTTLLDAISGLGLMTSGAVIFDGASVERMPAHQRSRRGMTRTFQTLELFEDLTVEENLLVAAEAGTRSGRGRVSECVERVVSLVGLSEVLESMPPELSHGVRKRVALGRALAGEPSLVLLDEPAGGLDAGERAALAGT